MAIVFLSSPERLKLRSMQKKGSGKARVLNRARILLKLDAGETESAIATETFVCAKTVRRIRSRYEIGGLKRALFDLPRPGQPPIVTDKVEAHLVALACSAPPEGRVRWTLELLQNRLIVDKKLKHLSSVAVLKHLKKRGIKPWVEKNVVYPKSHQGIHRAHGDASRTVRRTAKSR